MPTSSAITGRIRDQNNRPAVHYLVEAFTGGTTPSKMRFHKVGETRTDGTGTFEISLPSKPQTHAPTGGHVRLKVGDRRGTPVLTTQKESTSWRVDFQIKLGKRVADRTESDIYQGGLDRITSAYREMRRRVGVSDRDVKSSLESLIDLVSGWRRYRNELVRNCGAEVVQVPRFPRRKGHEHAAAWDEAVLPA